MEILSIQPFLHYYERLRERAVKVTACIPANAIEWTHAPGKFSFGDILRHLAAIESYLYAETVQLKPSD
jgi:phosphoribosylformylglycinamidine (FGAM) synthase-like amidotransferase family enzyme